MVRMLKDIDKTRLRRPCYWCDSHRFGVIRDVKVEIRSDRKYPAAVNIEPRFVAVVCAGCGATTFFSCDNAEDLLKTCYHEFVDVEPGSPYR